MYQLVICEKPSQGKSVAAALGGGRSINGAIQGDGWIVAWCVGHLMRACWPEEYKEFVATFPPGVTSGWVPEVLPFLPKNFRYRGVDVGGLDRQYATVIKLIKGASDIVIGTDPDREGEMIGWELLDAAGWKGKVQRLWMLDTTKASIIEAYNNLRDASDTYNLYLAARARSKADFLVGVNNSRAAAIAFGSYGERVSVGRIQSPVVYMIYKQFMERKGFTKRQFFVLDGHFTFDNHRWVMRYTPSERIFDRSVIEGISNGLKGQKTPLRRIDEIKFEGPPRLFSLATLQQLANALFGWSADYTLAVLQVLYDNEYVSYPRSDFDILPIDHKSRAPEIIAHISDHLGLSGRQRIVSEDIVFRTEGKKPFYHEKADAHYAIVPSLKPLNASDLNITKSGGYSISRDELLKLYEVVARRFLAAHMPDSEVSSRVFTTEVDGAIFSARSRQILSPGWRTMEKDEPNDNNSDEDNEEKSIVLPDIADGSLITLSDTNIVDRWTSPPEKMTERALLRRMRGIANYPEYVSDPKMRSILKETSGLGTVATQGAIIKRVKDVGYVVVEKGELIPSQKGIDFVEVLREFVPGLLDPAVTATWEMMLEGIVDGSVKEEDFIAQIHDTIREDVRVILSQKGVKSFASSNVKSSTGKKTVSVKKASVARLTTSGTKLNVEFSRKDEARGLGARWNGEKKYWYAPNGADLSVFKRAGFL